MKNRLVFSAKEVAGFSPRGYEDTFISHMLIDQESVGSERMVMNYFILKPGKSTDAGSHPPPYDEIYYILRGQGTVYLGSDHTSYKLTVDSVVFIPHGTIHFLTNEGMDDLEMITVMPGPLTKGANTLYDERKETWGTSFKLHRSQPDT